jgi:hypothetical protein
VVFCLNIIDGCVRIIKIKNSSSDSGNIYHKGLLGFFKLIFHLLKINNFYPRGKPSPRVAITFLCISELPPAIVPGTPATQP